MSYPKYIARAVNMATYVVYRELPDESDALRTAEREARTWELIPGFARLSLRWSTSETSAQMTEASHVLGNAVDMLQAYDANKLSMAHLSAKRVAKRFARWKRLAGA